MVQKDYEEREQALQMLIQKLRSVKSPSETMNEPVFHLMADQILNEDENANQEATKDLKSDEYNLSTTSMYDSHMQMPNTITVHTPPTETATTPNKDHIIASLRLEVKNPVKQLWINSKTNISMKLAQNENAKKEERSVKEMVPTELHDYLDVFDKETAARFPESRPWDHAIDLKEDFVPQDCKVYPLTLPEHEKMCEFIDENLAKGYIRPSKSPMASPFFFVDKKDGKLRPCQDY